MDNRVRKADYVKLILLQREIRKEEELGIRNQDERIKKRCSSAACCGVMYRKFSRNHEGCRMFAFADGRQAANRRICL